MSFRKISRLALAVAWTAALVAPASAQDVTGTISGTVTDDQGGALPGATVTIINESTNNARTTVSSATGDFSFPALQPSSYTVRVELASFRTHERKNVQLSASGRVTLGAIKLALGQLSEVISVVEAGTKVNPENSQAEGLITANQIENIQTKGRDVTTLMRLLPGVRYTDDVESLGESFGSLMPNVSGQRAHWNGVTVDGVMGNEIGQSNRIAAAINLDAIAEVKVLLNTYKAEFGRSGGANIQIVTKGGDSTYKGAAYYYNRHEKFNANGFFANRNETPKGEYRFNTFGFNLGGPVPGLKDKKLFFFYSMEAPQTKVPGPFRVFTMPTERERNGDFSQTVDSAGRPIFIRDPNSTLPCVSPTATNAAGDSRGCFPGNIIPQSRINRSGQSLLNIMPLPNATDPARQYNFTRQETTEKPKMNNVLRFDWKPSEKDSMYLTLKDWYSDQRGNEITAGPPSPQGRWGLFTSHYKSTDRTFSLAHTHIFGPSLINEATFGVRQQTEQFYPVSQRDWDALNRTRVGFTAGQFHPELNPHDILPKADFTGVPNRPAIGFDNRLADKGIAWYHGFRDNLTYTKGRHTFKGGFYVERVYNSEGTGGVGAGPWAGQFNFNNDTTNPLNTNHPFSNALLGVFSSYTEINRYADVKGSGFMAEWYLQDTWKASRRLTLDYGVRFLWYQPWANTLPSANFNPDKYDPAKAPRLYVPTGTGNAARALDPVTGQTQPAVFIGAYVPGTGDPYNGMELSTDAGVPRGFRNNQGIHPEPRIGMAYDLLGSGKTVLRLSAGLFHMARVNAQTLDQTAAGPPNVIAPTLHYGTLDTFLQTAAFSERPTGTVLSLERDAQTGSSYNFSLGFGQELGWGTAIDINYIATFGRHLEGIRNINLVPDGARFLDQNPQNRDPRNVNNALPAEFLRPYRGYQTINYRHHFGTSNYNGLQVQLNRRYIKPLQFGASFTWGRALGISDEDGQTIDALRDVRTWNYAPLTHNQTLALVVNYTYDLPKGSALLGGAAPFRFLFDGWQLSGENAWIRGDWAGVDMSTSPGFDFDGGDGGNRAIYLGGAELPAGERDATPGVADGRAWLNPDAFARPAGRGDYGNTPRTVFRKPSISNWNLSLRKNFALGGRRRVTFIAEAFNVLNHTQFNDVNNDLQFDAAGAQINRAFGEATSARNPRVMQFALRMSF
jgi:hypothetical protein